MSPARSLLAILAKHLPRFAARFRPGAAAGDADSASAAAATPPPTGSRWKRWSIEALVILAIVGTMQLWGARGLPEGPAPQLAGTLADGRSASLAEALAAAQGRPVLVAFWATWCPICKAEEGNVAAVARDWPTLTVAMQSGERIEVAKYLHERQRTFAALVDADGRLSGDWGVRGVPTHFIVDGKGIIQWRGSGYATEWGLRARLWWIGRSAA